MAELDDDREGIEPEALDEDAGDPAAAFDALRRTIETQGAQIGAEMTVMRRGLEAAFDQLERIEPQADYKPQLAQLVQQLGIVAERLHGVEQSPILRQGAQHYAAVLEGSGEARGVRFGPSPALSAEQIAHARQLIHEDKKPVAEVAQLLGVHRTTIYRAIERIDVDTH